VNRNAYKNSHAIPLSKKYQVKPKGPDNSEKSRHNLYIFGKFIKNGAFFVFTAYLESLMVSRESRVKLAKLKSVYYNENL
jgi:hypothetical protein